MEQHHVIVLEKADYVWCHCRAHQCSAAAAIPIVCAPVLQGLHERMTWMRRLDTQIRNAYRWLPFAIVAASLCTQRVRCLWLRPCFDLCWCVIVTRCKFMYRTRIHNTCIYNYIMADPIQFETMTFHSLPSACEEPAPSLTFRIYCLYRSCCGCVVHATFAMSVTSPVQF